MIRGLIGIDTDGGGLNKDISTRLKARVLAALLPAMICFGCQDSPETAGAPDEAESSTTARELPNSSDADSNDTDSESNEPAEPEEPAKPTEPDPPVNLTRIEETDRVRLDYSDGWSQGDTSYSWSDGTAAYARDPGRSLIFNFTGTRVSWIGSREECAGIAHVYVDGNLAGEVDLYSETAVAPEPVFTSEVLASGPHTLKIEVTGTAHPEATDSHVKVDAFDVTGGAPHTNVYTVTDLGTLEGGDASSAEDINNRGEIVGWSTIADGNRRAFLYRDGEMINLETLDGGSYSEATAINDIGQVTGFSGINEHGPMFSEFINGFLWAEGTMDALVPVYCFCSVNTRHGVGAAYGIDNSGNTVGWTETIRGFWVAHAAQWPFTPPVIRGDDIGAGAGAGGWEISRAYAVNEFGQVVGDYAPDAGRLPDIVERRPFLWRDGMRQELDRLPGYVAGTALDINWAGGAAGWSGSVDAAVSRAVLWRHGTAEDLGTLHGDSNSQALDINASGHVVGWSGASVEFEAVRPTRREDAMNPGWSDISEPSLTRAFIWRNGEMFDLNQIAVHHENGVQTTLTDWVFVEATAINDAGQIVGTGFHNGEMRGFLLTPCD